MLVEFEIPKAFLNFTDSAVVRMGYLFPKATISQNETSVSISSDTNQGDLKQEFLHLLYREKIYFETLDIRKGLFKSFVD